MNIEEILSQVRPRRKITGIAAALLPFDDNGAIAVEAFKNHLLRTHSAGLINAVNMDTGYVNYLSEEEQQLVLKWTREALPANTKFVAGAYSERLDGDVVALYRRKIDLIIEHGGTPIIVQTARAHHLSSREKVRCYQEICRGFNEVLCFELAPVFAPNGEIFDEETMRGLMDIPELVGLKHSSLDRIKELERLALRDKVRPEFRIYTGNDLAIDMIEYGSDYLLGLATFAPEKFAERDRYWETGNPAYYALSDALQQLGCVAFRPPIPAYKHSAAIFLKLMGHIPSDKAHPKNPTR
ncbi:MAG TPA: dihydrodipicolinate synthase family protein, partial [Pyrinomonadaceae bacterium]